MTPLHIPHLNIVRGRRSSGLVIRLSTMPCSDLVRRTPEPDRWFSDVSTQPLWPQPLHK